MMLLTILPDWNSLDSMRRSHSDLEAAALVFFALLVVAEGLSHSSNDENRRHLFDTIGIWFFAIAVICEIVAYPYGQRNDELSGQAIVSLDAKAKEAAGTAKQASSDATTARIDSKTAFDQAKDALTKTDAAEDAMTKATADARSAQDASSNALTLASGARTEADSYAQEITAAKQQSADASSKAADAVSRLADSEQKLADATQKQLAAEEALRSIKMPRSLIHTDDLTAALKPYKGTEYILNTFMDNESIQFMQAIGNALEAAGWVRKQPAAMNLGIPTMEVIFHNGSPKELVPSCVDTGISIHAHTKETLPALQAMLFQAMPETIRAALILRNSVTPSISPPDAGNVQEGVVDPKPDDGIPMTICVGKKP